MLTYRRQYAEGSSRPAVSQVDNMMDIGTRPIFSEEHDMFRHSVRRFFQEEVAPNHAQYENFSNFYSGYSTVKIYICKSRVVTPIGDDFSWDS